MWKDPMYYHTYTKFEELIRETEKAYNFKIDGVKIWMPKKLCRQLNQKNNTVWLYKDVYEDNMRKSKLFIEHMKEKPIEQEQKKLFN